MRFKERHSKWVSAMALGLMAAPMVASAEPVIVRRDTVLPIIMEDELSFNDSRKGDRFYARFDEGRDVPNGTVLEGRILDIREKRGDRAAYMELEFQSMILPDGKRVSVRAVPTKWDARLTKRDADGRLVALSGANKEKSVIGGVLGGLVLGSLVKKPFEGAFIGALAGIVHAETQKGGSNIVAKRGQKFGAYFEKDVRAEYSGRWDNQRNSVFGNARVDDRYDDRYLERTDERYDNRRYDRNDDRDLRGEIVLKYQNREIRYSGDERPYWQGDTVMVPLERTARHLGLDVAWAGNRTLLVEDDRNLLRFELDSTEYRVNGRKLRLDRAVTNRSGIVYVPVNALTTVRNDFVYVNGTKPGNKA